MYLPLRDNDSPMDSHGNQVNKIVKFSLLLISCLLFRLLPFRAPNIEPITATLMPISGAYGKFAGIIFAILSVVLFDSLTGTLGVHTFFTAGAFGLLGFGAGSYFRNRKGTVADYVRFAIVGTLFFDAFTGLLVGPIFFQQSLAAAFYGQIPFTALHLAGNIVFAATLSPVIHHLLIKKRKQPIPVSAISPFSPKTN